MGNTLQNTFEPILMESYSPRTSRREILRIKCTIQNGIVARDKESPQISKKISDIIPSKINFTIKNNIAISTKDRSWVNNNIPISELLCCEGLNRTHYVSLSREQHYLIAKVNLNTSSSMF
jgi:hypothetical protein